MAKDIRIANASYPAVPSIVVPKVAGGTAEYIDPDEIDATLLRSLDPDFAAGNIKEGVNLFGLTGTHQGGHGGDYNIVSLDKADDTQEIYITDAEGSGLPQQTKTLNLGAALPQNVLPDSGYTLSGVLVTVNTAEINAAWILEGHTILGVAGTYEPDDGAVARIGDNRYMTLQAALDAVQPGQTITFLTDITASISLSKSITIDLNGKRLTASQNGEGITSTNGTVTVRNGVISSASGSTGGSHLDATGVNSVINASNVELIGLNAIAVLGGGRVNISDSVLRTSYLYYCDSNSNNYVSISGSTIQHLDKYPGSQTLPSGHLVIS